MKKSKESGDYILNTLKDRYGITAPDVEKSFAETAKINIAVFSGKCTDKEKQDGQ